MYAGLGAAAGAASVFFAKWLQRKVKSRWLGHFFGKNEKEHVAKAVREFLEEYRKNKEEK